MSGIHRGSGNVTPAEEEGRTVAIFKSKALSKLLSKFRLPKSKVI